MHYKMSQDRNPYYDSARDKPDRSEFASLRMDVDAKRRPSAKGGGGAFKIVAWIVVLVVAVVLVKRFLLT